MSRPTPDQDALGLVETKLSQLQTMAMFLGTSPGSREDVATNQMRARLWPGVVLLADRMEADANAADERLCEVMTNGGRNENRSRRRIAKGVYRDACGLSAVVKVGTKDTSSQREKRFAFDTPLKDIRQWQEAMRAELRAAQLRPVSVKGALEADAKTYLAQVKHLTSYKSRVCEVAAWTALYGRLRRTQITAEHVRKARAQWVADGYAVKTINNRVQTLQHVYHLLDGEKAPTPCDEVKKLAVPVTPKVLVPARVFQLVAENLKAEPKTRARLMVIAATGVRPSELRRAEPGDVDLTRGVWMVRTGKGGALRAIVLNDDMRGAWEGSRRPAPGATSTAATMPGRSTPPAGRRTCAPTRHATAWPWSSGSAASTSLTCLPCLAIRTWATTRRHYQGILASRLKGASDTLAGRFNGWQAPDEGGLLDAAPVGSVQ